jgi:hypothetical protein
MHHLRKSEQERGAVEMPFVRVRAPTAVQYRDVCMGVTGAIGTSYSVLLFDRSVSWRWDVVPRSIVLLVSGLLLIPEGFCHHFEVCSILLAQCTREAESAE